MIKQIGTTTNGSVLQSQSKLFKRQTFFITMKKKMHIHYDKEGDYLEVRFGKPTPSHFEHIGDGIFERHDDETKQVRGYAIFGVLKRKNSADIEVPIPVGA